MTKQKTAWMLVAILLGAAIIRFWNLTGPDMLNDPAHYSMRAMGFFDYIGNTNIQTTPIVWFPEHVWWQGLSFHDAPPFVFVVQWIFFNLFGDNLFAARLPFVLVGLLSIYGVFLLGKLLKGEKVGLMAAGVMAVMNYHVWISRIGFLDGFVIAWVIFSLYFFLKAEKEKKFYIHWGIFVGLGLLTKYTFLFTGPVFLTILLWKRRDAFKNKFFWSGIGITVLLLLPVIIYNTMMVVTRGHPDAALSTLLGMHPEDFKSLTRSADPGLGRAIGGIKDLFQGISIWLTVPIVVSIIFGIYALMRRRGEKNIITIGLGMLWIVLMISVTGGGDRYGVVMIPFFALSVAWVFEEGYLRLKTKWQKISLIILGVFLLCTEGVFAIESQILKVPTTDNHLFVQRFRPEWLGYNALENYVSDFYKKYSNPTYIVYAKTPQARDYHLKLIQNKIKHGEDRDQQSHMLIFDDRMDWFPSVWTFEKRRIYEVGMIPSLTNFIEAIDQKFLYKYIEFGFTEGTIIIATDKIPHETNANAPRIERFIAKLKKQYPVVDTIENVKGETVFEVFTIPLGPEIDSLSESK